VVVSLLSQTVVDQGLAPQTLPAPVILLAHLLPLALARLSS